MPSKAKKQSKASPRILNSEYSASPQTSTLTSAAAGLDINEQEVHVLLEEASSRFPNLIGKSAFVGYVANVRESHSCKIWLSESSMVASSISPGSVVSVSLAASRIRSARTFPLTSFLDELTKHFKVELTDETTSKVGDYFALATVFPSSEVGKNGIMLSSSLSYTMGCPASESLIFVYPVDTHSIHISSELFLELVPAEGRAVENNGDLKPRVNLFEEIHGESENISSLSPRTPLCQPKIRSTPSRQASEIHKVASTLSYSNSTSVDLFDMKEILKDESTKQILQACVTSELYSRALVCGNLFAKTAPLKIFFFRVVGINKLIASSDQDLVKEKSHSSVLDHFEGSFLVNHETKVHLCLPNSTAAETSRYRAGLEKKLADTNVEYAVPKLGGLSKEYATLSRIISSYVKNTSSSCGLRPRNGVLLHGPIGTGKSSLARLCVRDAGVNLFTVNGSEIVCPYDGETEQAMENVFRLASQAAPAVIFIDELDSIAPAMVGGDKLSQLMVNKLLNLMDGINRIEGILVIAATNRLESIEPALRRHGRFGKEIEIGVPSPVQRLDILQTILGDKKHSLSPKEVQQLALSTHGFVGADLDALYKAARACCQRYAWSKEIKKSFTLREDVSNSLQKTSDSAFSDSPSSSSDGTEISKETLDSSFDSTEALVDVRKCSLEVSFEDFEKAKLIVRPSAMREVILEVPKVKWEDVGGQVEVKIQLKEAVLSSEEYERGLKRIGVSRPAGILMFGPPGCSKTLIARAVASEANLNFLAVKGPELYSKWVGESEKAVRSLFAKARANAPSIIFFDEFDGLATIRGEESEGASVSNRVVNQLLVELDGLHKRDGVTVIAATNRPDKIDPALLRTGRFDRKLYVGPPNEIDREDVFRIHLRNIQCCSDVSIKELAGLTEGYTGADISRICHEALIEAIEESYDDGSEIDASKVKVTFQHLKTAIAQVEPTETHSYKQFIDKYQNIVSSSSIGDDQKKWSPHIQQPYGSSSLIKTFMRFLFGFLIGGSKSTSNGET